MAKIDIIVPDFRVGGFEKVRVLLANEFVRQGHQVTVVMMQHRGELLDYLDIRVATVDLGVSRGRNAVSALARSIRDRKPDAILAGLWPLTTIAALARSLSRHRCRLVLSEHNQLSQQYASWGGVHHVKLRASLALTHRLCDASVAVSKGVATDVERLALLPVGNLRAIYNPAKFLHTDAHDSVSKTEELWGMRRGPRLLTVGKLKRQKNHALLLEAMARLDRTDSRLIIVGDGDLLEETKARAAFLGLGDRVIFTGYIPDPSSFYATADVFVLSSDYEGMPNVLSEALSFGLPVVSTDCPSGPREILQEGRCGALVPVGEVEPLVEAIASAIAEPIDRKTAAMATDSLTIEATARSYLELLLP